MTKAFHKMTASELVGRKVRCKREIRNKGGATFQAGSIATITGKWKGVEMRQDDADGRGRFIRFVNFSDLELLPTEDPDDA